MAMLRAGADIVGYELRDDFAAKAERQRRVVPRRRASGRATASSCATSTTASTSSDLDRIVLDLPEPWNVVKHAEGALRVGGIFFAYVPSTVQVAQLREALDDSAFAMAQTNEVLQRGWYVKGAAVAPGPPHGRPHRLSHHGAAARVRSVNQLDLIVLVMLARRRRSVAGAWASSPALFSWLGLGRRRGAGEPALPRRCAPSPAATPLPRRGRRLLLLLGGAFAGQALGLMVGLRIHRVLPIGPIRLVDRSVGAALGAVGVMLSFWLFMLPWLVDLPGWPAQQARSLVDRQARRPLRAAAARQDAGAAPSHRRPQLSRSLRQARSCARDGPAAAETGFAAGVQERVALSTVKIEGEACRRIQEGSGFGIAADLVRPTPTSSPACGRRA